MCCTMIYRYAVLLCLLACVRCQTNIDDLDSLFNAAFADSDPIQSPKCQQIDGKIKGCHECYPCNHSTIAHHRSIGNPIQSLTLNSKKCVPVQMCCINQLFIATRSGSPCGVPCGSRNPDGAGARQTRAGVRTVLDGEYPWAGYLYKKVGSQWVFACGATYVQEKFNAFVTSGACVRDLGAASLAISFYQAPPSAANVARVIVHEGFDADKGHNNIAIITLRTAEDIPPWALPACLPDTPALHATPCITLERDNNIINVVIPKKKVCEVSHSSQTCAVAPPDDFRPAPGSGMLCETECEKRQVYILYGVASGDTQDDITVYADVYHFYNWITRQLR